MSRYYHVDLHQGDTENDVAFGYVHSENETGWFFEYPAGRTMASFADVRRAVATLAADEVDRPSGRDSMAKAKRSLFRALRKTIR